MINLLKKDLYTYELPWGQSMGSLFTIFKEKNVHWNDDGAIFDNLHEPTAGWWMNKDWQRVDISADYSYGMVISKDQYHWGTYTLKCKLPNFRGSWPALWFIDIVPASCGGMGIPPEIDVMEHFRKDLFLSRFKTTHTYHDITASGGYSDMTCKARWQWRPVDIKQTTFQFTWQPGFMQWIVNGKQVMKIRKDQVSKFPDRPMNILLGSGLGNWKIQDDKLQPFEVNEFYLIN